MACDVIVPLRVASVPMKMIKTAIVRRVAHNATRMIPTAEFANQYGMKKRP